MADELAQRCPEGNGSAAFGSPLLREGHGSRKADNIRLNEGPVIEQPFLGHQAEGDACNSVRVPVGFTELRLGDVAKSSQQGELVCGGFTIPADDRLDLVDRADSASLIQLEHEGVPEDPNKHHPVRPEHPFDLESRLEAPQERRPVSSG